MSCIKILPLYFPISTNLSFSLLFFSLFHSHINTEYMVLSGSVYHMAMVQLLVFISVGSWWYFLPVTRAESGTGWVLLPGLAHPTCTHWPQPLCSAEWKLRYILCFTVLSIMSSELIFFIKWLNYCMLDMTDEFTRSQYLFTHWTFDIAQFLLAVRCEHYMFRWSGLDLDYVDVYWMYYVL